ncbi:hypothetical protein SESBI_39028 [Sesbania bispinosa]|nr:hypothetical protein SESBI_39028 [Sesbania bispinosa]
MEPSQMFGGVEECESSSESGWTMYIGSPMDDDDDGDSTDHNRDIDDEGTTHQADPEDDESDDSMASDASSGPSHVTTPWGNGKGMADFKEEQQIGGGKKVEKKEIMLFIDGKGKSPVQGGHKVRKSKNYWLGKRK